MPVYYERKIREHVWFIHRVTGLEAALWAVCKAIGWVFILVWRLLRLLVLGIYMLGCLVVGSTPRTHGHPRPRGKGADLEGLDDLEW